MTGIPPYEESEAGPSPARLGTELFLEEQRRREALPASFVEFVESHPPEEGSMSPVIFTVLATVALAAIFGVAHPLLKLLLLLAVVLFGYLAYAGWKARQRSHRRW